MSVVGLEILVDWPGSPSNAFSAAACLPELEGCPTLIRMEDGGADPNPG